MKSLVNIKKSLQHCKRNNYLAKIIFSGFTTSMEASFMQINSVNNFSVNSNYNNNVTFSGRRKLIDFGENHISSRAIKIVKEMSNMIETDWKIIKSSDNLMDTPHYYAGSRKGDLALIKPLYQPFKKLISMEIQGEKYIDRIIIDRAKPNNYTYERAVITPHGSATLKSFDSTKERNFDIEHRVSNYIETYFSKVCQIEEEKLTKHSLGIPRKY